VRSRTLQGQRASLQTPTPALGVLQRKCACGTHTGGGAWCSACAEKERALQRKATNDHEPTEVPPIVYEVLRSPGQPLDAATRAFFEPRFGQDFSQVRVHTDAPAAESASAVNAPAYTVGEHVAFAANQLAFGTSEGRRLLAHELTHVVQQGAGMHRGPSRLKVAGFGEEAEQEAESSAQAIQPGQSVRATRGETVHVARKTTPAAQSTQGRYWDWLRRDLQSGLNTRGVSGSEPFWNESHNVLKFLSLLTKLENFGIWPLVSRITNTWFGISVFGVRFTPTDGAALLALLRTSKDVIADIFPPTLHPGAAWSFRDKAVANSLHITGNDQYQAHIDTFNPTLIPIGTLWHGLVDVIPSKLGL